MIVSNWISNNCKFAKFINNNCCFCDLCGTNLKAVDIYKDTELNISHMYEFGILYRCGCGKSEIWTNSIRNEQAFYNYLNKKTDYYMNGFCNDRFCPFCGSDIDVLENGVESKFKDGIWDRIGCYAGHKGDKHNTNIIIDFRAEIPEGNSIELENYYRQNIEKLKQLAPERNK